MTAGTRRIGDFCWINILTPNPAEACAFFSQLLGWTISQIPGQGHALKVGGRDIGALFDLADPKTPKGTPPMIGVMVRVESADITGQRVVALGGRSLPAFDIMDHGRMAVCFDPGGAEFDVWQAKNWSGTDADSELHGAPSWFETLTNDVDRATEFYCGLFAWTSEEMLTPAGRYIVFKLGAASVAGALQIAPKMGELRPHWRTYFTVRDAGDAAGEALRLGATISMAMREVPGGGRICGIISPQGVPFMIAQYKR